MVQTTNRPPYEPRPAAQPVRAALLAEISEVAQRAEHEAQRAEHEAQRAEHEAQRAERLAARLKELGINPDA